MGSVLTESYRRHMDTGDMHAATPTLHHTLETLMSVAAKQTYWTSARKRVKDTIVASVGDDDDVTIEEDDAIQRGSGGMAVVPQLCVAGTVTRRASEKLWLTAANVVVSTVRCLLYPSMTSQFFVLRNKGLFVTSQKKPV